MGYELNENGITRLLNLYYGNLQKSRDGGRSWDSVAVDRSLVPVAHAVVLQGLDRRETGEIYAVFRDSSTEGTTESPSQSQLRIRVGDMPEAVVEIMIVTGPWDEISIAEASEL